MKPGRGTAAAVGMLALVAVVAWTGAVQAQLRPVRVGTVGGLTDAGIFIGQAKGYFKEQGISLDYKVFGSSSDFMPALGAGQLDVAGIVVAAGLFNSVASGINLRVVGDKQSIVKGFAASAYAVRKDLVDSGKVKKPADLKGMRFAVSAKPTLTWFHTVEWARLKGLKEEDVNWVELGYPQMMPSLQSKSIEGAMFIEPFLTRALDAGAIVVLGDAYESIPGATGVPIVYSEEFATKKRDLANQFIVAYMKGVRDYNDAYRKNKNRAEITKILAAASKTDPAVVDRMLKGGLDPDQKVDKKWIAATQDFLFNHKYVPKKVDIDRLIDSSFAEYAVQQLGGKYRY